MSVVEQENKIDVSIICTAFNHESFIEKAIQGFIEQKTKYSYEIILHDDASTDSTASIIKKYKDKYPSLITAILQAENQNIKGFSATDICLQLAKGKYIALCEGDDYWDNPLKLEMQIDYMYSHEECSFCFTNGKVFDETNKQFIGACIPCGWYERQHFLPGTQDMSVNQIVHIPCAPTASFVIPRSIFIRITNTRDLFSAQCFTGDFFYQLFATSYGYAHFIDEETCVYRTNNPSSVTGGWRSDKEKSLRHITRTLNLLNRFNEYTGFVYADSIKECSIQYEYILAFHKLSENLQDERLRKYAKENPEISYVKYCVAAKYPNLYQVLRQFKSR